MRGQCIVQISPEALASYLRGQHPESIVESNAPDDIEVVGCFWDAERRCIKLVCESETWKVTPSGDRVPLSSVTFKTYHTPALTAAFSDARRRAKEESQVPA